MRRRVRLTGRRQLPKSSVKIELAAVGDGTVAVLSVPNMDIFKHYHPEASVSLRLVENKRVEIVEFGKISKLRASQKLSTTDFVAPSCQLRVADSGYGTKGLLLGSTDSWTLRAPDKSDEGRGKGIINFLPYETHPQTWKLEIRDDDYPIVQVDRRIPNAAMWASNDPIFTASVLPHIVRQILDVILREEVPREAEWVGDWLKWAEVLMPGTPIPDETSDEREREDFIDSLLDTFCARHDLADRLLDATKPKGMTP